MAEAVGAHRQKLKNRTEGSAFTRAFVQMFPFPPGGSRAKTACPIKKAKVKTKTTRMRSSGPTERSSSRLVYPPSRHAPGIAKPDQSMSNDFVQSVQA
eukprot:scaffold69032_cov69-Phaeocystis_antarctica.AAC.5